MHLSETRFLEFKRMQVLNNENGRLVILERANKTFATPFLNTDYKMFVALATTNSGNVDRGIELFKAIVKENPRRYDGYQFLASIYEQQKKYALAISERLKAKNINPWGADSLLELQKDYLAIGDNESALKIKDEIVNMAPNTEISKSAQALNS